MCGLSWQLWGEGPGWLCITGGVDEEWPEIPTHCISLEEKAVEIGGGKLPQPGRSLQLSLISPSKPSTLRALSQAQEGLVRWEGGKRSGVPGSTPSIRDCGMARHCHCKGYQEHSEEKRCKVLVALGPSCSGAHLPFGFGQKFLPAAPKVCESD